MQTFFEIAGVLLAVFAIFRMLSPEPQFIKGPRPPDYEEERERKKHSRY